MPIRAMVKHARERPRRAEAGEASLSRHRRSQPVIRGLGSKTSWSEGANLALDEAVAYARRSRGSRGRPSAGWASLTPTEARLPASSPRA